MLVRLLLEQFVLVERGELAFGPGLNVLTGETGAGKSILIDALGLLVGGRGSADWIRRGAPRLAVEGVFDLAGNPEVRARLAEAEIPLDEEEILIVRREIGADGRSRSFANGRQVLVSQLRAWTEGLVWIVGQGEQRALLTSAQQELLLDRLAGSAAQAQAYRRLRRTFAELRERRRELERARETFRSEEEWLAFQVAELEAAGLAPGEREALREQRAALLQAEADGERRREFLARLRDDEASVLDHLESLLDRLAPSRGAEVGELWRPCRDGLVEIRERVHELLGAVPVVPTDDLPGERARIEERLAEIARLLRKHGDDEETAHARLVSMRVRLEEGRGLDPAIAEAVAGIERVRAELHEVAERLSAARRSAAERLSARLLPELEALAMPGAALRFDFEREEARDGIGPLEGPRWLPLDGGLDRIGVRFQSHEGLDWGDLGRVASGGELSRVLLAMQAVLGEGAPPATWVFDEVDQGVGGETARRVGERLARMAVHTQVLLVTHLPAIAALADQHLAVEKLDAGDAPVARIHAVGGEERLAEIARMLSGDPHSEIARRHAAELLATSRVVGSAAVPRGGAPTSPIAAGVPVGRVTASAAGSAAAAESAAAAAAAATPPKIAAQTKGKARAKSGAALPAAGGRRASGRARPGRGEERPR